MPQFQTISCGCASSFPWPGMLSARYACGGTDILTGSSALCCRRIYKQIFIVSPEHVSDWLSLNLFVTQADALVHQLQP